jgi:hypothetical protein
MSRALLATLLPIVVRARAPFQLGREFQRMLTASGGGILLSLPIVSVNPAEDRRSLTPTTKG